MPKKESLPNGTILYTGEDAPITTDALLLAEFCELRPEWAVCDLCSGNGILLLSLIDRGHTGPAVAVELNEAAAGLLRRAAAENDLPQLEVHCGDLKAFRRPHTFDMVVANPPYFSSGKTAATPARATARHQLDCTIGEVCHTAAACLKDRARFCLCWPAEALAPLFAALAENGLAPKRLQLVRKTPHSQARLALVEARKNGGAGLAILPDRLLGQGQALHY